MPSNIGRRGSNNTYRSKPRTDGRMNTSSSGNQRRGGPGVDRSRNSNNQSYRNSGGNVMDFGRSSRPIVSPWESGVTPGVQSGLLGSYAQPTSLLQIPQLSRLSGFDSSNYGSYGGPPSKMRRLERGPMGSYDDQRGRGLLPSPPGAPLLGVAPQSYGSPANEPFVRQRLGSFWNNQFPSGSAYFPSDRSPRNLNRRQRPTNNNRSRRPQQKSPTHKGGSSQESRNRVKGSRTTKKDSNRSKSPESSKDSKEEPKKSSTKVNRSKDKDEDLADMSEEHEEDEDEKMEDDDTEKQEDEETKDENQDSEKRKEKRESEKKKFQEDDYPPKALYCHICDLDSFSCRKGYVRHLQGLTHSKMSELFHAKNAATLELLNISAKLAEMRQRDKVLRRTGKRGMPVMKTTEQILVQKWLKVGSCCGMKFKSPFELEEHKLSLNHLKTKYESQPESKEDEEITKEEEKEEKDEDSREAFMKAFDFIEEARKLAESNPLIIESIGAYDPSKSLGLEFLRQLVFYNCKVCQGQAFHNVDGHCQSHKHYTNIVDSINKKEDAKREKKRIEEEKAREAKREAERKEKARKLEAEKAEEEAKAVEAAELAEEILDSIEGEEATVEADDVEEEEDIGNEGEVVYEEEEAADEEEPVEEEYADDDVVEEDDDEGERHAADEEVIDETSMDARPNGDDVEMKDDVEDNLINEIAEGIDYDVVDLENQIKDEEEQSEEAEVVEEEPDPSPKRTYSSRRRGRARRAK